MRFAPTEDQIEFASAVRGLLSDTCPPSAVAAAWGGEVGRHTGLGDSDGRVGEAWAALTDMGVLAVMVPEANGGLGMAFEDLVGILIECGRAGLPDPVADTAAVAAPALVAAGAEPAGTWLERIAAGATVVTGFGPEPLVPSASSADAFVLFSDDPGASAPLAGDTGDLEDARVWLCEATEVLLEPRESVDGSRALCEVVRGSSGGTVVLAGREAAAATADAFDRAALADAALLVGLARTMLETTVDYVSERKQFGVPVGSFQAVKHHLANAGSALEFAEPLVLHAAHLLSGGASAIGRSWGKAADRRVAVSMAKARASGAAQVVSETALQCHGAIGYTVEADLQLFMKRAWALSRSHGDADLHRARVQHQLLAGA